MSLSVLEEEQDEYVVFVLAGVQAAALVVTEGPDFAVEFGFFESHSLRELITGESLSSLRGSKGMIALIRGLVESIQRVGFVPLAN